VSAYAPSRTCHRDHIPLIHDSSLVDNYAATRFKHLHDASIIGCLHDESQVCDHRGVLGRLYENQNCSAARALEVVGERWSLLILRDAMFRRMTRFSDFQRSLGLAPNILTKRLEDFIAAGIMDARPLGPESEHREYVLTAKGRDLKPVVIALTAWGDRWAAPDGPPVVFEHEGCGGRVEQELRCTACGVSPKLTAVIARATNPSRGKRRVQKPRRAKSLV
jgi:DNA-binding HxlR family transcriptional regulator